MGIVENIVLWVTAFMSWAGYGSLVVLMAMESMVFPLPSELVMPFAGFLIFQEKMSLAMVALFSTLGTILGSVISYYMGDLLGRPLVVRYGKYLFLNVHHLEQTEKFFNKYGEKTIFISRFIPVVRHLISIPAGFGKMNMFKFVVYTAAGGAIWNSFLAYLGIKLGQKWELVHEYSRFLDIIVIALGVIFVIWYVRKYFKNKKTNLSF